MLLLTQTFLAVHILSGFTALSTGFVSMLNRKGGRQHRLTGKIFFIAITGVFVTAIVLSILKPNPFLFMVGFFSYYLACSGYRALYLNKLPLNQKPGLTDWIINGTGLVSGLGLLIFSIHWFQTRGAWGFVPLNFGFFCLITAISDIRNFYKPQQSKLYHLINHGSKMGGAFAATVTAFIVVNFTLGTYTWVLWILPGFLIGFWISKNMEKLKTGSNRTSPQAPSAQHAE